MHTNPFKVGDKVRFVPNERAQGWSWFGPGTIQLNDIGIVRRIKDQNYLYITQTNCAESSSVEVGGFHWECFERMS